MAYGKIYTITFKNRRQNDIYRCEIWQKDFVGDPFELKGADTPFTVTWQEQELLSPIKSSEFTISYNTDPVLGSPFLETFYSDDDEEFRVDFYFQSDSDGGGTEKLLHTGYLIQDGSTEPVTDRRHVVTLKTTDNLALLKSVKWNEATPEHYGSYGLSYYFRNCLKQTGLFSHDTILDLSLPLRLYGNFFENTTDDRDDDILADPYTQTVLHSGIFQSTDNTWDDCYTVLEKILTDLNACLIQADGYWNIIRAPEYRLFADGQILGTEYIYNGSGTDITAINLEPLVTIDRAGNGNVYPIEEDQIKSILRPYKYILNTFNYNQPGGFIIQQDLQIPPDAVPFDTDTAGDLLSSKYDLATYFPDWIQRNGDTSYLEVITNTVTDEEVERFIHKPADFDTHSGVQFNPISVSANDSFDFSFKFRTFHTDGFFWVRFILITEDGNYYSLEQDTGGVSPDYHVFWDGPHSASDWFSDPVGVRMGKDGEADVLVNWQLSQFMPDADGDNTADPVLIPADGMLLIEMDGNSSTWDTGFGTYATEWLDIVFTFNQYINKSTQITGQTHKDSGTSAIKATNESELNIDDSPRRTIAGTLFTNELTNFDHTDTGTGEITNIGNIFFDMTHRWHRSNIAEELRLGNIITLERLQLRYTSRYIVEGSFRNLRYDTDKFISLLSYFKLLFVDSDKYFLCEGLELDYMNCSFRAKLVEMYVTGEEITEEYLFQYLYKSD